MVNVIIKESKIEGKGVFANRNFNKGEIVIQWDTSHKLIPTEAKKLSKKEKRYLAYFKRKYFLMQPPARFVNHSCDSNTLPKDFCDIAKRNIKKGEEITSDYSLTETANFKMKCKCGSRKCRKIIKSIKKKIINKN